MMKRLIKYAIIITIYMSISTIILLISPSAGVIARILGHIAFILYLIYDQYLETKEYINNLKNKSKA